MGIVQGHAYSLISVKTNVCDSGINLLCLRNPWGSDEWSGDWGDDSDLWDDHQDIALECGHTEDEDGMFWISFEDFCENYRSIYVCKKGMTQSRGKKTVAINKQEIASGKIDDRPVKTSPGIQKNRMINAGTCGF